MALAQKETAIDRYFSDYEDGTLDNGDSTAHKKGSAPTENLVGAHNPSPEGVRERSPLVELRGLEPLHRTPLTCTYPSCPGLSVSSRAAACLVVPRRAG